MSLLRFNPIDHYPRPGDRVILAPGALDVRERPGFLGPGNYPNNARWIIAGVRYFESAKRQDKPIEQVQIDNEVIWRKEFMLYPGILNTTALQRYIQQHALGVDVQPARISRSLRPLRRGTRR